MINSQLRSSVQSLCQKISKDRLIIQGPGGNVSWKTDTHLWIKLSGTWIEDTKNKDIFGSISIEELNILIEKKQFYLTSEILNKIKFRPSIEVMLHAIIKKKFVFHLHMVNVVANLINNPNKLISYLKNIKIESLIIPYRKPGEDLAEEVYNGLLKNPKVQILLLENHGVVLYSDMIEEIDNHINILENYSKTKIKPINKYFLPSKTFSLPDGTKYNSIDDDELNFLVADEYILGYLSKLWPICPDHLVFLGPFPVIYDSLDELKRDFVNKINPILIFIKKTGIFVNKKFFTKIHIIQLRCFFDIVSRLDNYNNVQVISDDEIMRLINWDAEKYRMKISNMNKTH